MIYGMDVKLPGMLNAAVKACPVFGGLLKSFDDTKITSMPGVRKVVRVNDSAVAVVADTWWQAKTALEALPIVWDEGENAKVSSATIAAWLKEGLDAPEAFVGNSNGDVKAALANSVKRVEAVYGYPYQNHACMEPLNATALYTPDKCDVWTGTQNAEAAFAAVVEASGLPAAKCDVHKTILGGGFGRRGRSDYVAQAVSIAKQMPGVPIKLIWSREEDMTHGTYHPVMQAKMVGGFDANNNLTALHIRLSGQSIIANLFPQNLERAIPTQRTRAWISSLSKGFSGPAPSTHSVTRFRTCSLTTPCGTRTSRPASGGASISTRTPSSRNVLLTNWHNQSARTNWSFGVS